MMVDVAHLKELIHRGYRVRDLDVRGATSRSTEEPFRVHPVVVLSYTFRPCIANCTTLVNAD